ncbi:MAG: radical SAM protein, partial [Dehalococcoidia bacterium]|nr:radical SAM protein [Dehalococcoidia bacterium]
CESHPLDFQPELLKLMKKAGCTEIKVGLETTHPGLLQEWGRVACAEEAEQYLARVAALVQICRELEVRCHLFLMVGVPGQTKETLRATHDYLAKVCPPSINVKFFHPYGGIALPGAAAQGLGAQEAVDFSRRLQDCQTPLDHKRRRFHFPPFGIPSRRGSRVGPSP